MFQVRNPAKLLRYIAHATEEENISNSVLKSGATVRSEILVILGHRAARQETSRVLFRFDDRILGSGFSSTEDRCTVRPS